MNAFYRNYPCNDFARTAVMQSKPWKRVLALTFPALFLAARAWAFACGPREITTRFELVASIPGIADLAPDILDLLIIESPPRVPNNSEDKKIELYIFSVCIEQTPERYCEQVPYTEWSL